MNISGIAATRGMEQRGQRLNGRLAGRTEENADAKNSAGSKSTAAQLNKNPMLDGLYEQRNNIIESKNKLISSTLEKGESIHSIKDRLDQYEEQLKGLDDQINKTLFEEQQKNIDDKDEEKKEQKTSGKPISKEDAEKTEINNMVNLSFSISQIKAANAAKTSMEGSARILESEIKIDEGRGVKATRKREELAKINQGITETAKQISASLNAVYKNMGDKEVGAEIEAEIGTEVNEQEKENPETEKTEQEKTLDIQ